MVYTEYFARGTEPTAYCDQHPTRGIMTKLAGIFGGNDERPAPPRVEDTGLAPPTATATAGTRDRHGRGAAAGAAAEEARLLVARLRHETTASRSTGRARSRRRKRAASA